MAEFNSFVGIAVFYSLILLISTVYLALGYRKNKNRIDLFLVLFVGFMGFWAFLMIFSFMFISTPLFRFNNIFFAIAIFFLILFIDLIRGDSINILHTSLSFGMVILVGVLIWVPESAEIMEFEGISIPFWSGINRYVSLGMLIFSLYIGSYWIYGIMKNAPQEFKKAKRMLSAGFVILAIGIVIGALNLNLVLMIIVASVGFTDIAYILITHKELFYLFPFEVYRISVIEKGSGLPLYDFAWIESNVNEALMGGLLQSMQHLSVEVLKSGEIEELNLKSGKLLFQTTPNILVGLLASNTSLYLRESFKLFIQDFERKFQNELISKEPNHDVFHHALDLINRYFPNIPIQKKVKMASFKN